MAVSSVASSFHPPTAGDSFPSPYPSWVLLDKSVSFAHHENATTKQVKTSTDHEVQISFCLADPPAVSHFCIRSPQIRREDYTFEPQVVSSAENLVLICLAFRTGPGSTDMDHPLVDFLVCKASSGGELCFEPVPYSPTGSSHSYHHAGIVPRDGGNFLVAHLSPREDRGRYDLHVFSSETSKWTTKYLQLQTPANVLPRDLPSQPDKVISLGGSVVGWVDLWRGIVFCDVLLEKKPVLRFIPLPTTAFNLHRTGQAQKVRDVAYCNGYIRFVEIEHFHRKPNMRSFMMTQNLDTEDVISDKACLIQDDLDIEPETVPDGWKIRTMFRVICWDHWKKRCTVHVDDISAGPEHSVLLSQVWNDGAMLKNLKTTAYPFFEVYSDSVVYLMSKVESDGGEDSWIVGVDLQNKKLEVIKPHCGPSDPTYLPCAFSEYMNATPRSCADLVAAGFSRRNGVANNHLPLGDTTSVASSAHNGVLNNHLPSGDTLPAASSAQNGVPNGHLPVSDTQLPQNTLNVDGYDGSWNGSCYGAHLGYNNCQQPTPLQPMSSLTVQPMSSQTRSGYIFARWSDPDVHGKMSMTVPLDDMMRLAVAPLASPTPPMPVHSHFAPNY